VTDPLEHIRKLAHEIGARGATRDGEREAAAYIEEQLESFGYSVDVEPFRAPPSFGFVYMLAYALSLAGFAAAALGRATLGLLLSGIGLIAFLGENTTALRLASVLIPRLKSQNVVGRLVPRELPRRRLIISAHYDSARSGLMFHPRLVRRFRTSFLFLSLCLFAIPVLEGVESVLRQRLFWYISIPFALYVAYAFVLLLHRELRFEHVSGANDNASGVAVMLSLAEALAQDAPEDTEVVALATGSEESGLWGMEAFLKRHKEELGRVWLINIDNVGGGQVSYTTAEGMLLRHNTGKELRELAEKVGHQAGLSVTPISYRLASTDAEPALLRGIEAITVIGTDDGIPLNWHWETDTYENIDPDSVDTAYRFVEAMVRRLIA
jgi:hypothetical protein